MFNITIKILSYIVGLPFTKLKHYNFVRNDQNTALQKLSEVNKNITSSYVALFIVMFC